MTLLNAIANFAVNIYFFIATIWVVQDLIEGEDDYHLIYPFDGLIWPYFLIKKIFNL